jgi:hypothetical protein
VEALDEHTVLLSEGSELPADVVVYATATMARQPRRSYRKRSPTGAAAGGDSARNRQRPGPVGG